LPACARDTENSRRLPVDVGDRSREKGVTISMTSLLSIGLLSLALVQADAPPPAGRPLTIETLDGRSLTAENAPTLTADSLEVNTTTGPVTLTTKELQTLRWGGAEAPTEEPAVEVRLNDGSILNATGFQIRARQAEITTSIGAIKAPSQQLRTVRLSKLEEALAPTWNELAARDTRNDLLVVRKGEALDFIPGVIGELNEKELKVLVKSRDVAVPRDRVFGLIFVKPEKTPPEAACEIHLADGSRLRARKPLLENGQLSFEFGDEKLTTSLHRVVEIDFSLGRVKALADLPMEQSQFAKSLILTPNVFEVRKNHTSLGQPLKIGDREYSRGLWIHSGAAATFRLAREYRRLTGVVGIDSNSPELAKIAPRVHLTISGDGKPLFEGDITWSDDAKPLDLDVSGVRDVEIKVASPEGTPGILEHLDFADARVVK
jgi:hypothetical protein